MKEHMRQREIELQHLPGANERWENYMQYTQSRMVPRFTEKGGVINLTLYERVTNHEKVRLFQVST